MAFEQQYPLWLFLFLTLLPYLTCAQNISLQSSLTAQENDNSFRASPSGDFAFGFREIVEDGFLLAVWFNKIPDRTIVWWSNEAQNLVPRGSTLELSSDGFWLYYPSGQQKSIAISVASSGVDHAALLDTGNLVLVGYDSSTLWQSFDEPTDTILPSQVLNQPFTLFSRYLENNYTKGRFQFTLENGSLSLLKIDSNFRYWQNGTTGSESRLIFNQSGQIFLEARNGSVISNISSNNPSTEGFYQRAILDYDGVFRHYRHPKISSASNSGNWTVLKSIPSDICIDFKEDIGSGACGFNSYCTVTKQRKSCHCPPHYNFIDPNDEMKGCMRDFLPQSCDEAFPETQFFDLFEMPNIDWPSGDYEYHLLGEYDCRQACLGDCFCAGVTFVTGYGLGCYKKSFPLHSGRFPLIPTVKLKSFIKFRIDNDSTLKCHDSSDKKNDQSTLVITGSVLLSSSVFLNLIMFAAACLGGYRFFYKKSVTVPERSQLSAGINLRSFTYQELSKATNEFNEELGRGAFSTVYKGSLSGGDGNSEIKIAVKKLINLAKESEFEAEVNAIGGTNHRNLVKILGFCNEREHRLLVYEFMSNGSLASFLFAAEWPGWYQRMQIAIGVGKGLLYLHEECSNPIIHCDIKPQNILLDDSYTAKICDFGLAKLLRIDQTQTATAIRGTKGYVAPEWFRSIPVTFKVDVYSYGTLLLELICCRKNFDANNEDENQMVLIDWAYDCFNHRGLSLLVKDDEEAFSDMKNVEKYVMIAIWCIQEEPSLRPTMKRVLQMLEGDVDVPLPPNPTTASSI